jgi:hypothetical protein
LENLGWNLLRIWSTDYFVDPNDIIEKTHQKLVQLLENSAELVEEIDDEIEDIFEVEEISDEPNATKYFNDEYRSILEKIAKETLEGKNGITLQELASDIGYNHDLARTTKKQLDHIKSIIQPWAGLQVIDDREITVWSSPEDIVDIIDWRGVDAFGTPREWSSLAYPEQLGLAKVAISNSPNDPVDFIFNEFRLSRRTKSTTSKFENWVSEYKSLEGGNNFYNES